MSFLALRPDAEAIRIAEVHKYERTETLFKIHTLPRPPQTAPTPFKRLYPK